MAWRAVVIGALGVVFGDIGTSPIYTVQTVFNPGDPHPVRGQRRQRLRHRLADLLVGDDRRHLTYVLLVMRADNDGEGGIMALITLIRRRGRGPARGPKAMLPRSGSSARRCSSATA